MTNQHNPMESCENCPIRKVGCRKTCEGWLQREEKKKQRYEAKTLAWKSYYVSRHYEKALVQLSKKGKKGNSVGGYQQ